MLQKNTRLNKGGLVPKKLLTFFETIGKMFLR